MIGEYLSVASGLVGDTFLVLEHCGDRQEDGEDGAGAKWGGAGAEANGAAMLVHNLAADPQSQAGARVLLGCEERLKNPLQVLGRDAVAGVGKADAYARTGRRAPIA